MDYVSKNIDHLGIVAALCKELELIEEIDKIVGVKDKQRSPFRPTIFPHTYYDV
jgi:hypothetical protein